MTDKIAQNANQVITSDVLVGSLQLEGFLSIPEGAMGIVVFAHGSGSSRFSPRNQYVAKELQKAGLATLLFDLLLPDEADDRRLVFDIPLLSKRVAMAGSWLQEQPNTKNLKVGYWGSSTGAAAALVAAVVPNSPAQAIVSRGGRADLAGPYLELVKAPTLLVVGGLDGEVITLNQQAFDKLNCIKSIEIVPGATHLFEEAGCLEQVVQLTANWFCHYLGTPNIEDK